MHTFFRRFTLNRLGAALFIAGILLLIGGVVGVLTATTPIPEQPKPGRNCRGELIVAWGGIVCSPITI